MHDVCTCSTPSAAIRCSERSMSSADFSASGTSKGSTSYAET
jgi:hypothetical protein